MSNSSVEFRLEILADSKIEKTLNYDFVADYFVTNSFTNEDVNSNFSITKDIFKAKFPYSENFWKTQNQLPISNELKTFLTKVSENKKLFWYKYYIIRFYNYILFFFTIE